MRDFALMIRAHLNDGVTVRRIQVQQRERYPYMVIQIAARDQRRPEPGENRSNQLFGRRLAVATRYADDRNLKLPAPLACEGAQRFKRVSDDNLRKIARYDSTHQGARS